MKPTTEALLPRTALMNQWNAWRRQQLGWPAAAAAALWLMAGVAQLHFLPGLQESLEDTTRATVRAQRQLRSPEAAASAVPAPTALETMPGQADMGATVGRLLQGVRQSGLQLLSGDYVLEEQEPGLVRLRATLPVKGSYPMLRRFIAKELNANAHAALDGLTVERAEEAQGELTAQLRLSYFFRKGQP